MAADTPDDARPAPLPPDHLTEQEMREAEDLALAASGLGSGLLKRQQGPITEETVAVLKVCPQCGNEYETAARFCPTDGTSLRPKGTDSLIDRVLAERYHILKRIGEGGMGRVYLGEHVKMNRQCAIKVMSPALVNDHESATRFAREASSAARIIHPNVAAVFDYGESEGLVYLVMEFVDGEPLSRILAREAPLSVARATEIASQIADGLGAAHELGIIHRDLKPDNILIARTRAGREVAKVVDFGIAKAMQENAGDALTRTGLVIGTPEFMSPEQLLGDPIDARSDLYALGCILHLMLTATPPFAAATREQMIKRRLAENAPHVQQIDPGLPDSIDRIVERLLARTPSERYGSAAEVRDGLSGTHLRQSGERDIIRISRMTPRSAPTVAFEVLANADTESNTITAQEPGPADERPESATAATAPLTPPVHRRGVLLAAGGAVVALGAILLIGRLSGDSAAKPAPVVPVARRDSLAAAGKPTVPATKGESAAGRAGVAPKESAAPKTPPLSAAALDSIRAARSARRQRDSLARLASAVPSSIRRPIESFARAIASGDVGLLRGAYPALSGDQEKRWTDFFGQADNIKVKNVTFGKPLLNGTTADVDFTVGVTFDYRSSRTPGSNILRQHATLEKQGSGWQIKAITAR
jgi:serine/threonine-protein kinase